MGNVALVKKLQSSLTLQWVAKPSREFLPPILITLQLRKQCSPIVRQNQNHHSSLPIIIVAAHLKVEPPAHLEAIVGEDSLLRCQVAGNNIFCQRIFISCSIFWERIFIWCRRHILNGKRSQTRKNVRVVLCHLEKLQVKDDPNVLQKNAIESETKNLVLCPS